MIRTFIGAVPMVACLTFATTAYAAQIDIAGPAGSGEFGKQVYLLPNGNFVVTDPGFDFPGGNADVGAVYLYRPDGGLIHTLRGSSAGDRVGSLGITVLSNDHFVVASPDWDNAGVFDAGAATWRNGWSGSDAIVSASNSLVGGSASNRVSGAGVIALSNGSYVIASPEWDNTSVINAGAATWANGSGSSSGVVGVGNSMIGGQPEDQVGYFVTPLANGNYVVGSPDWNNGAINSAGAATWGNGNGGTVGTIAVTNSLVGTSEFALVGYHVTALSNGNYVAASPNWDNGSIDHAGAVTWGNGMVGISGVVSTGNSLVGATEGDAVGEFVVALRNGHYVVMSPFWDSGAIANVGAVTWANGQSGLVGTPSVANSLIGTTAGDIIGGYRPVTELSNGHYVVASPKWHNGSIVDAGAVTWRDGNGGSGSVVSASNSLVGGSAGDEVGGRCYWEICTIALTNGHYVVASPNWQNAGAQVGAVTWRDGNSAGGALVSPANSLIGTNFGDQVGSGGVAALSNGDYAVGSPYWRNGPISVGAVTWRSGNSGAGAVVGAANSTIGINSQDYAGWLVVPLGNGRYVSRTRYWDNGSANGIGAITWGSGSTSGVVSAANSIIGSTTGDEIGNRIDAQGNGNYIVVSPQWDNGATVDAGAVTLGFNNGSTVGPITAINSVRGTVANGGNSMNYEYDALRAQLIVGRPASSLVSLLRPGAVTTASITLDTPDPSDPGQVVTFATTIAASPAPLSGIVRIIADTGETCTDNSPTPTSSTTAEFSCQILFSTAGARSMRAEFLGTNTHGYSASGAESHSVSIPFANGFE